MGQSVSRLNARSGCGLLPISPQDRLRKAMKSRFRDYHQRLVQNQKDRPGLVAVINSDQYRDERGRFSTAIEATEEALQTLRLFRHPDSPDISEHHLMRLAIASEGMPHLHHQVARLHDQAAYDHFRHADNRSLGDTERRNHTAAALAHTLAAMSHRAAAERINSYSPAPNPGFSHLDRSERLIWADWLDDRGHTELAHHLRVYSS